MSDEPLDYHHLLYVLEQVKAACTNRYGVFYSRPGDRAHMACLQLEADGLIILYDRDGDMHLWKLRK